jgi:hypothetical protein
MNTIGRGWPVVFAIALTLSAWTPPVSAEEVSDATVAQPSISTPATTAPPVSAAEVAVATVAQPSLSPPATAAAITTKPRSTKPTVRKRAVESPRPEPMLVRFALPRCCGGFPLILGVGF